MSSTKAYCFGKELNLVPDSLGVHTSTAESLKLDIPLVADKLGQYTEDDITEINNSLANIENETVELLCSTTSTSYETFTVPSISTYKKIRVKLVYSNLLKVISECSVSEFSDGIPFYAVYGDGNGVRYGASAYISDTSVKCIASNSGFSTYLYGVKY